MYRDEIENCSWVCVRVCIYKALHQGHINQSENETVKFSNDYAQVNYNLQHKTTQFQFGKVNLLGKKLKLKQIPKFFNTQFVKPNPCLVAERNCIGKKKLQE